MEHVVFFPGADGAPAFRRTPTLEEAVRLVEHLRNDLQVADVSLHALTEVPLAFRAYYRVEVAAVASSDAPAPEPAQQEQQQPAAVTEQVPAQGEAPAVEAAPEPAGARARSSDGGMGFFAT